MSVFTATGPTILSPRGHPILHDVDLTLRAGEVTGLIGESGSGKSTLAQALLGHVGDGLDLAGGTVRLNGHDPFTSSGRRAVRGRVTSYLPQDPASALDPTRTIVGQLRIAARAARPGLSRTQLAEQIRVAVDAAALDPTLLARYPAQLSGGQAQRALLTWTFITRPRLLVLDEPTSGLDSDTALRVSAAFARLPWRPAVLMISHDRDLIARICDRILRIEGGRLSEATPASLARVDVLATPPARPRGDEPSGRVVQPMSGLSMTGVTIRRGNHDLLRDAELHLGAGELLAIRGRSGSGKTALARALCGLAPPSVGSLRCDGHEVTWRATERARNGGPFVAYVGQDARAALNMHETPRRTLHRALRSTHRRGREALGDPETVLELVGLGREVLDRTPDRLSGGQRHRVALARALAADPAVLVCDETTAALDHDSTQQLLDTLDRLRRNSGLAVLLITHQDSVAARADRILTIENGRLT